MSERHPGGTIRAVREARGLTLRALAKDLNISPATLSGIERETAPLSVTRLHEVAELLGTTATDLIEGRVAALDDSPKAHGQRSDDWRSFDSIRTDAIVSAALELFVLQGFHATSMREVATRAGKSVAGVYHHYPSKESVLVAILELTMRETTWRLQAARAQGSSSVESFALMVESLALFHAVRGDLAFIGASEMRAFTPTERTRMTALRDDVQHALDDQAGICVSEGHFRVDDLQAATRAIATMCTSLPSWFRPDGRLSAADVAQHYANYSLQMMGWSPR